MLFNRRFEDHIYERTAENCQMSNFVYVENFMFYVPFKNIQQKIPTKFVSTLVLSFALANRVTKDLIVMQICF